MDKLKRFTALFLVLALILTAFSGCAGGTSQEPAGESGGDSAAEPLVVTWNSSIGGELVDQMNETFETELEKLSGGKIVAQIIPNSTLGSARETVEACQLGSVDLIWAADSEINQVVGNMGWAWVPYIITSYEEADKEYNGGWIEEELKKQCEAAGITFVADAENGFRLVATVGKPIDSLASMKGLKIRVPEQNDLVQWYTTLGCQPTTITATESFTAIQQGTVDGADNTLWNLYNLGFFDILDYVTVLNYQYNSAKIAGNLDWWNGLTDDQRSVIKEAATKAGAVYRDGVRSQTEELYKMAEEKGIELIYPSEEFSAELKEVAEGLWDKMRADYGDYYIDLIFEHFGDK
jgi:tripartite ATP-independent transporter DctP family solute receptor